MSDSPSEYRYFTSYTGIHMPFRLVGPLDAAEMANRNTYLRAWFDDAGQLSGFDKLVYGEVELSHRYAYHPGGALARAEITMCDEDGRILTFAEDGTMNEETLLAD